ncbi:MAG: hypothetical protein ABIL58_16910 [Pseudomonadota bacterium]
MLVLSHVISRSIEFDASLNFMAKNVFCFCTLAAEGIENKPFQWLPLLVANNADGRAATCNLIGNLLHCFNALERFCFGTRPGQWWMALNASACIRSKTALRWIPGAVCKGAADQQRRLGLVLGVTAIMRGRFEDLRYKLAGHFEQVASLKASFLLTDRLSLLEC